MKIICARRSPGSVHSLILSALPGAARVSVPEAAKGPAPGTIAKQDKSMTNQPLNPQQLRDMDARMNGVPDKPKSEDRKRIDELEFALMRVINWLDNGHAGYARETALEALHHDRLG